jgi:membrane-associated phospholipid phosphatase
MAVEKRRKQILRWARLDWGSGGRAQWGRARKLVVFVVLNAGLGAAPKVAKAQDASELEVNAKVDGAITATAFATTLFLSRLSVDQSKVSVEKPLLSLDRSVDQKFSTGAADLSDALLATAIAVPLVLQVRNGFDESAGRRVLVYSETIGTSLLLNSAIKVLIPRPRPYVNNNTERARDYAAAQGDDAYRSFYSGHASTAFASAVAGSILFAQEDDRLAAKSTLWATQMGLASATTIMRVRAGKHYYSDVAMGVVVGGAMGMLVPSLHSEGGLYGPSKIEWVAIAAGLGLGTLAGYWIPLPDEAALPTERHSILRSLQFAPVAHDGGGGMAVAASF